MVHNIKDNNYELTKPFLIKTNIINKWIIKREFLININKFILLIVLVENN